MGGAHAAMLPSFVVAGCGARSGLTIPAPAPDAGADAFVARDAGTDAFVRLDVGVDARRDSSDMA